METDPLIDIKLIVAVIACISAVIVSYINYKLGRRTDKKSKKTEMRTNAYADYVGAISEISIHSKAQQIDKESLAKLTDAKTRIVIYGHYSVVKALAEFDSKYTKLDSEQAFDSFANIVFHMRQRSIGKNKLEADFDQIKVILFGKGS